MPRDCEPAAYDVLAEVYDRLMDDVDYSAWYAFYRALFASVGVERPRYVADVCCGTGEFTLRFAKDGIEAVGVDISPAMLAGAREKALREGIRAMFVQQNAMSLRLPRPCDAILCACDGVNYLASPEAARAFFARARQALRPGGALAFDISTDHKLRHILGGSAYGEDREDLCYLWRNSYEHRLCHMELTIFLRRENGLYGRFFERHVQRGHSREEIENWLAEAGFEDIRFFGDREMTAYREDDARMHVVAIKRRDAG